MRKVLCVRERKIRPFEEEGRTLIMETLKASWVGKTLVLRRINLWPYRYLICLHTLHLCQARDSNRAETTDLDGCTYTDIFIVVRKSSEHIHIVSYNKFLIIKPTRCTNFSNLFLEWNSTYFGQFLCPSSGVFQCTHSNGICHTVFLTACEQEQMLLLTSCQQTCMTYTIAVCTVKNSWWWTEELSETCRVSF